MAKINIESNIDQISGKFGAFGQTLLGPVKNALAAVRTGLSAIAAHPVAAVVIAVTAAFLALAKQLSKLQVVVDALDKAMLVLRQSFDFIITEIGAFLGLTESTGKSLREVIAEAKALADAQVALKERMIETTTAQAELRVQLSEYRAIAADATKTDEERIEALEKAQEVNKALFDEQREILEERIRLQQIENSAGETSREERQKLADLQAQLIQLNADENNANRELIATKSGLEKTILAKAEADRKEAEAIREKNKQLEIEARNTERAQSLSYLSQDIQLQLAQGIINEAQARQLNIEELERQYDAATTDQERKEIYAQLDQAYFEDELARIEEGKQAYIKASEDKQKQDEAEAAAKQKTTDASIDLAANLGDFLTTIAGENKGLAIAGLVIEQAASVASTISQTAIANAKAAAASPLTGGQPFVTINTISAGLSIASTIAATAKGIQQINSVGPAAVGGTAGAGGASNVPFGPSAATPRQAQEAATTATGGTTSVSTEPEMTIMAVVSEGDIRNSQERAARTQNKRRFGG